MRALRCLVLASTLGFGTAAAAPQWEALPNAPVAVRHDDLHFLDPLHGWVCSGNGRIHRTTDGGATWQMQLEDPAVYFRAIRFADAQRGWAGLLLSDPLLFATTNGGVDWAPVTNIPEPRPNGICGLSVASSSVIYGVGSFAGPARVIKSADGGATWSSMDLDPLASTLVDVQFRTPLEGFAVGGVGEFSGPIRSVVLHTTDGGATWQQRFVGTREGEWGWKISFPTPLVGYVSLERFQGPMFFLKTEDGGLTWTEHPFSNFNEQGIGFVTPEIGWVGGADNPTCGTTDGGATWTETPWGDYINRLQFLSPGLGYAAGVTVYRYAESPVAVTGVPTAKRAPIAAPNPFASATTIRFELEAAARVRLFIADPSGRIVRRLVDGPRSAGPLVVRWDGRTDRGTRAPAGIYLYVLHAGDRHVMGKVARVE